MLVNHVPSTIDPLETGRRFALSLSMFIVVVLLQHIEKAERLSLEQREKVIQLSPFPIMIYAEDGEVIRVNQVWEELTGYSRADIPTLDAWLELAYGLKKDKVQSRRNLFFSLDDGIRYNEGEFTVKTKSGKTRVWEFQSTALGRTADGRKLNISMANDVTLRKKDVAYLRAERRKASEYLEVAQVLMVVLDTQGQVVLLNRKGHELLGYQEGELLGKDWFKTCVTPEEYQAVHSVFDQIISGAIKPVEYFENFVVTKQGDRRLLAFHNSLVHDEEGRITGTLSSARDITEFRKASEALRESEKRYRQVVENSQEMIMVAQDNKLVFVNKATVRELGYPPEEISRHPFTDFIYPEDRAMVAANHLRRLAGEDLEKIYEFRILTASGQLRWVQINAVRIEWQGRLATLNFMSDVTERRQAEKALAESEELFRTSFENAVVGVSLVDIEGRYLRVNRAMNEMLGFGENELLGKTFNSITHPEDYEIGLKAMRSMTEGEADNAILEKRYLRKDGRIIWANVSVAAVRKPSTGVILYFVNYVQDITQRREAEQKNRLLATIAESSGDAIFSRDHHQIILSWNKGAEKIYGYSVQEAIGMSAEKLVPPERREEMLEITKKLNLGQPILRFETERLHKNGTRVQVMLALSPIYDKNGQVVGGSTIATDITEFRRLQSDLVQTQKMASVGELAGGIAHDFNNLLNVIIGYSDLALMKANDWTAARNYLEEIKGAGIKAASLTGQLLAFSRKQNQSLQSLSLNEVVLGMEKILKEAVGEHVVLTLALSKGQERIYADQNQLGQVLMNLCVNARDAMPQGGQLLIKTQAVSLGQLEAQVIREARPGDFIVLTVKDNGIGMNFMTLTKIFDPFFTTKSRGKGTGLGLSVTYGIVKQHNGWINVSSQPGKGTEFRIWFPRDERKDQEPKLQKKIALEHGRGAGEKILLVEDQPDNLALATKILEEQGYTVFPAENAEDALRAFKEEKKGFKLLFTDIILPGMDGNALIKEIRKENPNIRVLVTSGYLDKIVEQNELTNQGFQFLAKPYESETMLAAVQKALYS